MFVISKTHVGMVRTVNEDALLTTGPELFALADGMGGYAAGETASREALQVLQQEAEKFKELTGTELCTAMRETVQQANKHIRQMAQSEVQYHDMGTTLVAVYLAADGKAYAVNVGDSRLYVIGEKIQQITRDHSLVQEMVRMGELDPEQARKHPKKNIITRALGAEKTVDIDFFDLKLEPGDVVLMCSDGLSNMVEDSQLREIISDTSTDLDEKGRILIREANRNGGKDNIAIVLVEPFTDEVKAC
jgi:serine/threonine protein phosphatase PrpC